MKIKIIIILFILAFSTQLKSQNLSDIERISSFGKLWGIINFFHPQIPYGNINIDSLFIKNIENYISNPSKENYEKSVSGLLLDLGDPYSRILNCISDDTSKYIQGHSSNILKQKDSIIIFSPDFNFVYEVVSKFYSGFDSCYNIINKYDYILIDLRTFPIEINDENKYYIRKFINDLVGMFSDQFLYLPTSRSRYHKGYESEWFSDDSYSKGWIIKNGNVLKPFSLYRFNNKKICLIINKNNAYISDYLRTIQNSENVNILSVGNLGLFEMYDYYDMKLTDDLVARIRLSENINPYGPDKFIPDKLIDSTTDEMVYQESLNLFQNKNRKVFGKAIPPRSYFLSEQVNTYGELPYPPASLRLYALMKYWNIMKYFNPNKNLFKKNWDSVLVEFIPKFLNSKNADEYATSVMELVSQINDSHATVGSMMISEKTRYSPGIEIGYIENKTIISNIKDKEILKTNKIAVGDVITKIDGIEIDSIRIRLSKIISASNKASLNRFINYQLLGGKKDSNVKLNINHNGSETVLDYTRNFDLFEANKPEYNENQIWKIIDDNIGYVNLDLLSKSLVDSMFDDLSGTKAIIFDNRGYPMGTPHDLASHLTDNPLLKQFFQQILYNRRMNKITQVIIILK